MPSRRFLLPVAALAVSAASFRAFAQGNRFPDRPLRLLVPFAPGGPLDVNGRPLAEEMSRILGQTVVFENKPGANGIVATQMTAAAKPDGLTLLYTTGSFVGNVVFSPVPLPYDPERDLAPVTLVSKGNGMMLVGRSSLPAGTMAELAALARARPGSLTCAVTGIGNITHLGAVQFREYAGPELLTVVMQGTGPAITAMLGDQVDLAFSTIPPAEPHLRAGRLRAFGYTGAQRANSFPDVPTMKEAGYPDWELIGMGGIWTAAAVPRDRILTVQRAVKEALRTPVMERLMHEAESEGSGSSPEEFSAYLRKELAMQRGIAQRIRLGRQ